MGRKEGTGANVDHIFFFFFFFFFLLYNKLITMSSSLSIRLSEQQMFHLLGIVVFCLGVITMSSSLSIPLSEQENVSSLVYNS